MIIKDHLPHIHLSTVGSTNDEIKKLFLEGQYTDCWLTADEQTGGKARRGREWVSPKGNLYCSLLISNPAPLNKLPQLAFVTSLAMWNAVANFLPPEKQSKLRLKWPNDLLLCGKKLSGILLEKVNQNDQSAIIVGCGVNCGSSPSGTPYPTTSLVKQSVSTSPRDLFLRFAEEMSYLLKEWQQGDGFSSIRLQWLERVKGLGEAIKVNQTENSKQGIFDGIDEFGYLQLRRSDNSIELISAGDVFYLQNEKD